MALAQSTPQVAAIAKPAVSNALPAKTPVTVSGRDIETSSTADEKKADGSIEDHIKTMWMWQLLQLGEITVWNDIAAGFASWLIITGSIVFTITFDTGQTSSGIHAPTINPSKWTKWYYIFPGGIFFVLGLLIMVACTIHNFRNKVWISAKILVPLMIDCFAGLVATIVAVTNTYHSIWTICSIIEAIVLGLVGTIAGIIYLLIYRTKIGQYRAEHRDTFSREGDWVAFQDCYNNF